MKHTCPFGSNCGVGGIDTDDEQEYRNHMILKHGGYGIKKRSISEISQKLASISNVFTCYKCNRDFQEADKLQSHITNVHGHEVKQEGLDDRVGEMDKYYMKKQDEPLHPQEYSGIIHYMAYGEKVNPSKARGNSQIDAKLDGLKLQIKQAKMDIAHNHHVEWRASQKFAETPNVSSQQGKFAKIWLLNAKQVNGNGWGVGPNNIDKNIKYFVNRPYVITAKQWIPETVYETYDHPFVPTNNIHRILDHQEMYRVGTIRQVLKEGDDYYAMIEVLPKFAHMNLPPFCSPAVFQVDPREPENRIEKWIPLHLAGLDTQPAYGARIALLKGTCIGTMQECSVQLRTAKMLEDITVVCPFMVKKVEDKFQKLAITRKNSTTDRISRVEKVMNYQFPTNEKGEETERQLKPEEINGLSEYMNSGTKIRPPKPKSSDFQKIIQARLNVLGARIMGAKEEGSEEHKIIEDATQIYSADALGYVETPGGPKCGTCVWFEKDENECMWIKDRKVNGDNGCCDVWIDPVHAKTKEYAAKLRQASSVTEEEDPEEFFDLWNPSQLQHIVDPNDMNGTRKMVMKSYKDLTDKERDTFKKDMESRFNESDDPTIEDIKKWVDGLDASKMQHFVDPDNWYLPESMELSDKDWDDMTEPEKNEMISTYSFRHGGVDVSHLLTGRGIFYKRLTSKPSRTVIRKAKSLQGKLQKLGALSNFHKVTPPDVKINPEHGKQIADAYGEMKHEPDNPEVKSAYGALINETTKQYHDLVKGGLKITPTTEGYKNSAEMHEDLSKNNHLKYFPTEHGFGEGENNKDHPMMQETDIEHNGKKLLANDVFRIVHDVNGHHKSGSGFGPKGEHQAYLTHKQMYSPLAHKALFTETAAQNNYVNFGPHGEHNRTNPAKTIYAPQKAGIMPKNIIEGKFHES